MKQTWLITKNGKGITASIGLHLCLLAAGYWIKLMSEREAPNGEAYTITLKPTDVATILDKAESEMHNHQSKSVFQEKEGVNSATKTVSNSTKSVGSQQKKGNQSALHAIRKGKQVIQSNQPPKIDKRGLYHSGHAKQAAAKLELTGWKWDMVPNPKDATEECGKIVFEIKVDENGEIISIHTLEKTVTPMVEKIYADALLALTFSKVSEKQLYSSISTGKISFILVAK